MALFGIGGSKSSSQQQSQQQSSDFAVSQGRSSQAVSFGDLYAKLFGGATSAANAVDTGAFQGEAAQLFSGGLGFLENLRGGGAAAQYADDRLGGGNDLVGRQIDTLRTELDRGFSETVLPQIRSGAIARGGFGGGRQDVSEGIAARGFGESLTSGITNILTQNQAQLDSLAGVRGGQEIAGAGAGLGALESLLGISSAGATGALLPAQILAKILGPQTTLTESLQSSISGGQSTGSSSGKSKSGSFNFGFG